MKKLLFVLNVGDYRPELCRFTIPTTRLWAEKNGWEFREIKSRAFGPWVPITGEKMQIRDMLGDADWAMHVDADVMLRPDFPDPSERLDCVFSSYGFDAEKSFKGLKGKCFSGGFYGAPRKYFSIWDYPKTREEWEAAVAACARPHIIDEYIVSRNRIQNDFPFSGPAFDIDAFVNHFGSELIVQGGDRGVELAKETWENWRLIWPEIQGLSSPSP